MLTVGIGHGEGIDTHLATAIALAQAEQSLGDKKPDAAMVFAGIEFDHRAMLKEIQERFPGLPVVGCSTGAEFSTVSGFSEFSIMIVLFSSDQISFSTGVGREVSKDSIEATEAAVAQARKGLKGPPSLCLFFPDAFANISLELLAVLNRDLGPNCPIFGAASAVHYTVAFTSVPEPKQFFGTEVLRDSISVLLFSGPIVVSAIPSFCWQPVGSRTKVVESGGNEVQRIGDWTALGFYHHYMGERALPAYENPLLVYEPDGEKFFLRVPVGYDEKSGSVTFGAPVPEGSTVQLSDTTPASILKYLETSVEETVKGFGSTPPALCLAFSCSTRLRILGTRTPQELETLKRFVPRGVPIVGFYGWAEYSPLGRGLPSRLHNCTLVSILIGPGKPGEAVSYSGIRKSVSDPGEMDPCKKIEIENKILRKKLAVSDFYRKDTENMKDGSMALLKTVNEEIDSARRQIQAKNEELERLYSELAKEKKKSDDLLLNILPVKVADELKSKGSAQPVFFPKASVLFTDFKGFTKIASNMTPPQLVAELDRFFTAFDRIIEKYGLEKLKTIGDAYMCAGGLPDAKPSHVLDIVNAAWEIREFVGKVREEKLARKEPCWEIRIGVHAGDLVAGVIGKKKFAFDIWGDTVNIASRLESSGEAGQINVSKEVYEVIKDRFVCEYRGKIMAKNKGEIDMYFVTAKK